MVFWHLPSGRVKNSVVLPRRVLACTALCANLVAVHGELSEIYILDVTTGEQVRTKHLSDRVENGNGTEINPDSGLGLKL